MSGPERRSAKEAQAAILEVAERHLSAGGPAAVRVQKVAAELGITDAAVHYHFGNRSKLMTALLKHAGRKLRAGLAEAPVSSARAGEVLDVMADRLDEIYRRKGYARLAMWLVLDGWRSKGAGLHRPMIDRLQDARGGGADAEESAFAIAMLNVFMMGEALAGDSMLAAAGLPTDEESRALLRERFLAMLSASLGLGEEARTKPRSRAPKRRVLATSG